MKNIQKRVVTRLVAKRLRQITKDLRRIDNLDEGSKTKNEYLDRIIMSLIAVSKINDVVDDMPEQKRTNRQNIKLN